MCRIISANAVYGVTSVPNRFIDEFMLDADESQLKVYLYLMRFIYTPGVDFSFSSMAEALDLTPRKLKNALKHWQELGLISYGENENGGIDNIFIEDIVSLPPVKDRSVSKKSIQVKAESFEKEKEAVSVPTEKEKTVISLDTEDLDEDSALPEPVKEQDVAKEKPDQSLPKYTPKQMADMQNDESIKNLLQDVEKILSRTMSVNDINTILGIYESLSFSYDLVVFLCRYCKGKNKVNCRYIETVALDWADKGVKTIEDAKERIDINDTFMNKVRRAIGEPNALADIQKDYIRRWIYDYMTSEDMIIEAVNRSVLKTCDNRWEYAEGIIRIWREKNITTIEEVRKENEAHRKAAEAEIAAKKSGGRTGKSKNNVFNDFGQRVMTKEESEKLEAELIEKNSRNISDEELMEFLKGKKD